MVQSGHQGGFSTHLGPSLRAAVSGDDIWAISGLWLKHLARVYGDWFSSLSACEDLNFSPTCLSSFPCPSPVPVFYPSTVSCKVQKTIWQQMQSLLELC